MCMIITPRFYGKLFINMNKEHPTLLVLLDLSAAFDTVDSSISFSRLIARMSLNGTVLSWFGSYIFHLPYGIPQGSCLGPLF